MRRIIHHVRRQPENIRRHILHIMTVVLGMILVLLWIYSLGASIRNPETKSKAMNDLKPLTDFKNNMANGYYGLSDINENQ